VCDFPGIFRLKARRFSREAVAGARRGVGTVQAKIVLFGPVAVLAVFPLAGAVAAAPPELAVGFREFSITSSIRLCASRGSSIGSL
jgi:hypothetical protein